MRPTISLLLVEDDDEEALYIRRMLKRSEDVEFDVKHVVSLKNALTVIDAVRPDVVLLDLSLPDSHGYETATEFSKHTDVPFLVLTGNDDLTMAMRTTGLGAQDYLIKREVQAKPLERAIVMAVRRATTEARKQRLQYETMAQLIPSDAATVAVLKPRVSHLVEAFEDLENYLRSNAPRLMPDVNTLLAKHEVPVTIKEIRDLLRLDEEREEETQPGKRKRRLSDAAFEVMDTVAEKGPSSEPPKGWEDAEAIWDDLISKGAHDAG